MENRIIQFQYCATLRHIPVVLTYDVCKQVGDSCKTISSAIDCEIPV